jgi:hypothetical protein
MKEELKIEEFLNSFVDGELTIRQRTEVKRMAANDPKIASRLKQLQKCRALVSALPVAKAPSCVMKNIKASLEAKTHVNEKSTVSISEYGQKKTGFFLFRRVLAAAAVLTMATVLIAVINMLMPSQIGGNKPPTADNIRFSGKLELKSNDLYGVQSVISRAMENSGLAGSASSIKEGARYLYTINCSREGLNKFLGELDSNWDKLNSAVLFVDTKVFGESVQVKAIAPSQIAEIVNQSDAERSIKVAKDIAALNSINELLPDESIFISGSEMNSGLFYIPQPVEVKHQPPANQDNGKKTVQLRIILSR